MNKLLSLWGENLKLITLINIIINYVIIIIINYKV